MFILHVVLISSRHTVSRRHLEHDNYIPNLSMFYNYIFFLVLLVPVAVYLAFALQAGVYTSIGNKERGMSAYIIRSGNEKQERKRGKM